nr:DUF4872 domain-containing protein [Candidatus Njordarchaeum guaymaensis]
MPKAQVSIKAGKAEKKERILLPSADYGKEGVTGEVIKVQNFKHMPGYNCQFSSVRKVLAHYGWNMSEEMLLGLSSGLGMMYWEMKMMPAPFMGGFQGSRDMAIFGEKGVARLGGKVIVQQSASVPKAHQQLKDLLNLEKPVIAFVDMAFLPHFFRDDAKIPYEDAGHFGGHTVVVFGINEKEGTVDISDRFDQPVKMPLNYFQMARASVYQPFPAKNKLVELRLPEKAKPLREVLPISIKENIKFMMNPPISNFGLKGFLKFKAKFPEWYRTYDPDKFLFALTNAFIYMETGGSGGAWSRTLYSRFLKEAAETLQQPKLEEASKMFEEDVEVIRELENTMLPDELPNIAQIRNVFLETNRNQEEMSKNYRQRLRELDEELKASIKAAKTEDYTRYAPQVQKVQAAIQKVYDLEAKAWAYIQSIPL